jgi:hypothetical protein
MQHLGNLNYNFDKKQVIQDMVLFELYEQRWWADLNREHAVHGHGRNKLRTYWTFKESFEPEKYVKKIMSRVHRRAFALFRCGVAPIGIETGRYRGLPEDQRLCPFCTDGSVEDELHVLLKCPLYADLQTSLIDAFTRDVLAFSQLADDRKLAEILAGNILIHETAKTCSQILDRRRSHLYSLRL